ncbi:MAG: hypothetical protein NW214_14940 [Pseudanabaenaceae cyanobacterium bins.39]|nr:hypothetical protein [Pseudanabaenaceae cyanobacterium bins.39]
MNHMQEGTLDFVVPIVFLSIALLYASNKFWQFALKPYTSASS